MSSKGKSRTPQKKKSSGSWRKVFGILFILAVIAIVWFVFWPAVKPGQGEKNVILYIGSDKSLQESVSEWTNEKKLKNGTIIALFEKIPQIKRRIRSGAYIFEPKASQLSICMKIFRGREDEVTLTLSGILWKQDILNVLSNQLEPEASDFKSIIDNQEWLAEHGLNSHTVTAMFLPDSYRFYWDTKAEEVLEKLYAEYTKFWSYEKRKKAEQLNLNIQQVSILASIVDGEAVHFDEMPAIAGLYLNRLRTKMPLQADPTVKYALGKKEIRRLTYEDYKVNHPYNTYRIAALPPGPISMPSKQAINAVLNPENHDFFYMVARNDRSGYHHFTKDYDEHRAYTKQYIRSLNERGVER